MPGRSKVVARWTVRRRRACRQSYAGCGAFYDGSACPACGRVGRSVAVQAMALVVELRGGTRTVVVAERAPGWRWVAVKTMPATPEAVAALRCQQHGDELGGLFGSAA
jgi:hypothetical protein